MNQKDSIEKMYKQELKYVQKSAEYKYLRKREILVQIAFVIALILNVVTLVLTHEYESHLAVLSLWFSVFLLYDCSDFNVQLKTAKLQRKNEAMNRAIQKYEDNQEEGI